MDLNIYEFYSSNNEINLFIDNVDAVKKNASSLDFLVFHTYKNCASLEIDQVHKLVQVYLLDNGLYSLFDSVGKLNEDAIEIFTPVEAFSAMEHVNDLKLQNNSLSDYNINDDLKLAYGLQKEE